MPIKNNPSTVARAIQQALADKHLSGAEADQLLETVKKEGVTPAEVNQVVESLTAALRNDGLDFSSQSQEEVLNKLIGNLKDEQPHSGLPNTGSLSVMGMLTNRANLDHKDFPVKTYAGESIGIADNGELRVGDKQPLTDLKGPTDSLMKGLWALNRPGQVPASDAGKAALADQLVSGIADASRTTEKEGKYRRGQSIAASLGALTQMNVKLSEKQIKNLVDSKAFMHTPLQEGLLHRLLEKQENLSPEAKAAKEALKPDEDRTAVLAVYDKAVKHEHRLSFKDVKGETNETYLGALTFAKNKAAVENIDKGFLKWDQLESGYDKPFTATENEAMKARLESYVDNASAQKFTFGSFASKAERNVATLTSEKAVEDAMPGLQGDNPNLNGFPLSEKQSEYIQSILSNVQDKKAVEELRKSLATAHAVLGGEMPPSWGDAANPEKPMSEVAFRLFKEKADGYQDAADSSKTGKLDYRSFTKDLREEVESIRSRAEPRLLELGGTTPKWNGVGLDQETAAYLKDTLQKNTRSFMTVENLDRAVDVWAKHNGGEIKGDASGRFRAMVDSYKTNWPDRQAFDFNKLERMSSFAVRGEPMPKSIVNGREVSFAHFITEVGKQVSGRINKSVVRREWMADRWGYRASQAVEVLDVVAEKTARGEGPVAELRKKFPGRDIEVRYAGTDGEHEQFTYVVDGFWGDKAFRQGSDGKLSEIEMPQEAAMFTGKISEEGVLSIRTPDRINVKDYPLNSTYGVGDTIDLPYRDRSVREQVEKGEEFITQNKLVEAKILGFTGDGRYHVELTNPKGEIEKKTVTLAEIRKANNPHWFSTKGSNFSDVSINVKTDADLKKFLDEAQPIIDRHLPKDGSLVGISAAALAKRQKACIKELMTYTADRVKYPTKKETAGIDAESKKYHELVDGWGRFELGELAKIEKGVCRHQCIFEHLLLQRAGIDSRLASGAANTSSNKFRGYHIWTEVTLADGGRYLSDQTWDDPTIPLWSGAYSVDKRRVEMYNRTARYDGQIEL